MSRRANAMHRRVLALLATLLPDGDQSPEEAEAELVAAGVDVPSFLVRVHDAVDRARSPR